MKSLHYTAGLVACMLPALAYAQDSAAPQSSGMVSENDIVVTAQRRSERLQDVPLTVAALSPEKLQSGGVVTTTDLTRVVSGLVFAQNETFTQPAIRGVTTSVSSPSAESPIAIYLDGVYQPAMSGSFFELPDVERIEVLKGPQGTLFGRNATGGAVQIFTKKPSFETTGEFKVTTGYYTGSARNAPEVSASGFISTPLIPDKVAMSVSGFYRYNQGYMRNVVDNSQGGLQRSWGVRGKLLVEATPDLSLTLSAYYSKLYDEAAYERAPFDGYTVAATFPDAIIPTKPWDFATYLREPFVGLVAYGFSLRGEWRTSAGTLTSTTGYTVTHNDAYVNSRAGYSPACFTALRCQSSDLFQDSKALSQELNFSSEKFGIFSLTTGLFYFRNFGGSLENIQSGGVNLQTVTFAFKENIKTEAYAAYAELNADLTDNLHIIAGGRYSHERKWAEDTLFGRPVAVPDISSNSFTPRVSVRYSFDPSASIYATYSKGFKSGLLPPPYQNPLRIVEPEKLTSYEAGIKISKPRYSFNLAYFHYDYDNLQLQQFLTIGNIQTAIPANAGKAKVDGFDFDAGFTPMSGLRLSLTGNYMPTSKFVDYRNAPIYLPRPAGAPFGPPTAIIGDASGQRLLRAPKFTGTATIDWSHEVGAGRLGINASVYHSSAVKWETVGTITQKSYEDVTAQISYEFEGLRVSVFGKNLLNNAVITGTQPSAPVLPVVYGPPRQFGMSLGYKF